MAFTEVDENLFLDVYLLVSSIYVCFCLDPSATPIKVLEYVALDKFLIRRFFL